MSVPTPKDLAAKVGTPNKTIAKPEVKRPFVLKPHLTQRPFANLKNQMKAGK